MEYRRIGIADIWDPELFRGLPESVFTIAWQLTTSSSKHDVGKSSNSTDCAQPHLTDRPRPGKET
jgi:hypothetical protein